MTNIPYLTQSQSHQNKVIQFSKDIAGNKTSFIFKIWYGNSADKAALCQQPYEGFIEFGVNLVSGS